jgi:hypothetical protein
MQDHKRKFLTAEDLAAEYRLSAGHLANLRCKGLGPSFYRVGRKILYDVVEVDRWIRSQPVLTKDSLPE